MYYTVDMILTFKNRLLKLPKLVRMQWAVFKTGSLYNVVVTNLLHQWK